MDYEKLIPCSICGKPIQPKGEWYLGNNAQPLNNGRCCDDCNRTFVIPARFNSIRNQGAS